MTKTSRILGPLGCVLLLLGTGCRGTRDGEGPSDRLVDPLLGLFQRESEPASNGRGNETSIARENEGKGQPNGRPVSRQRDDEGEPRAPAPYRGRRERGIAPPPPPANLAAGLRPPSADNSDLRLPANERAAANPRDNPLPPSPISPMSEPARPTEPNNPARAVSLPNAEIPRNGIVLHPAVPLEPGLTPQTYPSAPTPANGSSVAGRELAPVQAIPVARERNPQSTGATVHASPRRLELSEITTIEQAREQLSAAGIDLDSATLSKADTGEVLFACRTQLHPGATSVRRYEGSAATELDAMKAVLREIGK